MNGFQGLTALRSSTILLVALALSIGWGIRGNFGHEYGAMIPGALAALAVGLLSGRKDWRERAPYFAFFGALGWAFGGSMSYMQVVAYTHSGHLPTQAFGFFGLFVLGFLWSAMGGAGTAFPAVVEKDRLTAVFRPLCWIFVSWVLYQKFFKLYLETLYPANFDATWSRQAAHTYWFDSDWMEASFALAAVLCFELWDNRAKHMTRLRPAWIALGFIGGASVGVLFRLAQGGGVDPSGVGDTQALSSALVLPGFALLGVVIAWVTLLVPLLVLYLGVGALVGGLVQCLLQILGWTPGIASALLHYQVSPEFVARAAAERGISEAAVLADQLINWPNVVLFYPQHIGWFVGLLIGGTVYFARFGRFGSGASLFMHLCVGWFVCFLLFPVLLGHPFYEGAMWFRMTPPRGDNWAGVLGVVMGTAVWLLRYRYIPVLYAMLVTGLCGGVAFSGGAMIKLLLVRPGNPQVESDPAVVERWSHWQQSNWHSVMEQTDGFLFGMGLAVAMGLLAMKTGRNDGPPAERRWTAVFATGFVLFGVVYLNMYKNVVEWVQRALLPEHMAAPLLDAVTLSAWGWFNLIFGLAALAGIFLMARHLRRPIALVPQTPLGKGQMLFLALLAAVAVMNFERALSGFTDQRLITEGVIFVNAILASLLVLCLPRDDQEAPEVGQFNYGRSLGRALCFGAAALLISVAGMTAVIRAAYGDSHAGHAGKQYRFGSEAEWRIKPTEKSSRHS